MTETLDIWKFLAGLGIFLMGLFFLEEALKFLVGSSFKKFLRRHTENPIKAILSGTLITTLLQSSSLVSLIVLAFVGARVMSLRNALGVIIGSNIGTTFTGWIVATLGFQLDIEGLSMPLIAIGGLSLLFIRNNLQLVEIGRLIMGFGLLFLGLDYMKVSIDQLATSIDIKPYISYGPYALFAVGFVLTALIQSSSAAMVITLSALHAGVLPLESAAGMVIGSDVGTTITVILGGLNGTASKKRVALGHFLFNLFTGAIALLFIGPLLSLIKVTIGLENPLTSLVLFHTLFNLFGVIVFLPFLGVFARFLENRFKGTDRGATMYINHVPPNVPEAAITALRKEIHNLTELVFLLHLKVLKINVSLFTAKKVEMEKHEHLWKAETDYKQVYETIKKLEGEIVPYYLQIQNEKLEDEDSNFLNQMIQATRHAMFAAKGVKDIAHNIHAFEKSANDHKVALFDLLKGSLLEFYLDFHHVIILQKKSLEFEVLVDSIKGNQNIYDQFLHETYLQINERALMEMDISTLLNVNREVYHSNYSLILSLKDLILNSEQAKSFTLISHGKA